MHETLLFELSVPGQYNDYLAPLDVPQAPFEYSIREALPLPEVDEHSLVRHLQSSRSRTSASIPSFILSVRAP
jgi:hypothetical protein